MNRNFLFFISFSLISILIVSCTKDKNDMNDPGTQKVSFTGDFMTSAHQTSGTAAVNKEHTTLTLTNFKTSSGPDVNIYLASDLTKVDQDYIDLGDIKGVDGNYTYDLPANVDFLKYKYVVAWCVSFHINFGYALLLPQ